MLAYTSHLPLASHCLSVLVTQSAVITCDTVGQYKEGQQKGKEEKCLSPCVFWVIKDTKVCCLSWK